MAQGHTRRLINLLNLLRTETGIAAADLAAQLRVSRRTLFRYVSQLESAGIPIAYNRRTSRYHIDRSYFQPTLNLTKDELLALLAVVKVGVPPRALPQPLHLRAAVEKVEQGVPEDMITLAHRILEHLDVVPGPMCDSAGIRETLLDLQQAISQNFRLWLRYEPESGGREIDLLVDAYRLFFAGHKWYLLGYVEAQRQMRLFHVDHVVSCRLDSRRFHRIQNLSLESYLGHAWFLHPGRHRYRVRLEFAHTVANEVEEVMWHRTQKTHWHPDGRMVLEVEVDGLEEISGWILGYGEHVEVLEPQELRDFITERARRTASRYLGPDSAGSQRVVGAE